MAKRGNKREPALYPVGKCATGKKLHIFTEDRRSGRKFGAHCNLNLGWDLQDLERLTRTVIVARPDVCRSCKHSVGPLFRVDMQLESGSE